MQTAAALLVLTASVCTAPTTGAAAVQPNPYDAYPGSHAFYLAPPAGLVRCGYFAWPQGDNDGIDYWKHCTNDGRWVVLRIDRTYGGTPAPPFYDCVRPGITELASVTPDRPDTSFTFVRVTFDKRTCH